MKIELRSFYPENQHSRYSYCDYGNDNTYRREIKANSSNITNCITSSISSAGLDRELYVDKIAEPCFQRVSALYLSDALGGAGQHQVVGLQGHELGDVADQIPHGEYHVRRVRVLLHLVATARYQITPYNNSK